MRKRLKNEAETIEYATRFARSLKPGDCVALAGDLGAGKSVFARAVMRALGIRDAALPSPTYSIIQEYQARDSRVAHMDWYRLEDADELAAIGVCEYFQPPWICLIEWPQRAPDLLPEACIRVHLNCVDDDSAARWIEVHGSLDLQQEGEAQPV